MLVHVQHQASGVCVGMPIMANEIELFCRVGLVLLPPFKRMCLSSDNVTYQSVLQLIEPHHQCRIFHVAFVKHTYGAGDKATVKTTR